MDPASIVGAVLVLIEAISNAYNIIGKVSDLPKAFDEVKKHLPLVKTTLFEMKEQLDTTPLTDAQRQPVLRIFNGCQTNAKELERIFTELEKRCEQDQGAKGWGRVRGWYRDALRGIKGHRVETLMEKILLDLEKLALYETFKFRGQVDKIKTAVNELAKVEPSLTDEEMEPRSHNTWTQNIAEKGIGQQITAYGGANTYNSGHVYYGSGPGSPRQACLEALCLIDPSQDKERVMPEGGLRRDLFSWVFDDEAFKTGHNREPVRLLWITGGAGKGKTMMLCGIIDELLLSEPGALASYFFCDSEKTTSNSATAVLRGLIWLLAKKKPSLESHIQKEYAGRGRRVFEDQNALGVLSGILLQMLQDRACKSAYLIVDAADQCLSGLDRLLEFSRKSFEEPGVKWIISSREVCPHDRFKKGMKSRQIDLDNNPLVSAAVDRYIDQVLLGLNWLNDNPRLRAEARAIIQSKADGRFLWVALLREEMLAEDDASLLNMLKDIQTPTNMDNVQRVNKLLGEGRERLQAFKNQGSNKDSVPLRLSLNKNKKALDRATERNPPYRIGMYRANLQLAECHRELSHRSKFTRQEQMEQIKEAEKHADAALSLAQEIGNRERVREAECEKAIMSGRTAVLAFRAAREDLMKQVIICEEAGGNPDRAKRARTALEQLSKAVESKD